MYFVNVYLHTLAEVAMCILPSGFLGWLTGQLGAGIKKTFPVLYRTGQHRRYDNGATSDLVPDSYLQHSLTT